MRVALVIAAAFLIGTAAGAAATDDIGFVDPDSKWYLPGSTAFYFGNPGDQPLMGDWDCDGVTTPGLYRKRDGFVYLRNSNTQGIADFRFFFGDPDDVAVAGDWDGDGCDTVSLWRPSNSRVYIIDRLGSDDIGLGAADRNYEAGSPGRVPFAFGKGGVDIVAFHDPDTGEVWIDGRRSYFGDPGDVVVAGNWQGVSALGAFRPNDRLSFTTDGAGCAAGSRGWIPVVAAAPSSSGTVTITVGAEEAKALGPEIGLSVTWDGGSVVLDACRSTADIDVPIGTSLQLSYLSPDGSAGDVTWQQLASAPFVTLRQPWRSTNAGRGRSVVLAWQSTGTAATYLTEVEASPGLTVTSPIWWRLDADGSVTGTADAAFVAAAHARGLEVWPAFASLDADRIHAAMADPAALAAQIAQAAQAVGADGVNIDLEGFRHEDAADVTAFAAELTDLVHVWGGATSFDITPRTDTWDITSLDFDARFWSRAPPRRRLADAVDYLILMAYDEHNAHRPAGPVASPHWVEDVTRYLLRYTDANRLILGIPLYGRLWGPDLFDTPRARGVGSLTASEAGGTRSYDVRFGLDRVDFADGTYLWSETPAGLGHRVALAQELGLAGLAAWRLGFDSPSIWPVIAPQPARQTEDVGER